METPPTVVSVVLHLFTIEFITKIHIELMATCYFHRGMGLLKDSTTEASFVFMGHP